MRILQMNSTPSSNPEELLATLGNVVGVSELAFNSRDARLNAPVLVSENALVFLAWQEDAVC
jgi:hypothetical protein